MARAKARPCPCPCHFLWVSPPHWIGSSNVARHGTKWHGPCHCPCHFPCVPPPHWSGGRNLSTKRHGQWHDRATARAFFSVLSPVQGIHPNPWSNTTISGCIWEGCNSLSICNALNATNKHNSTGHVSVMHKRTSRIRHEILKVLNIQQGYTASKVQILQPNTRKLKSQRNNNRKEKMEKLAQNSQELPFNPPRLSPRSRRFPLAEEGG